MVCACPNIMLQEIGRKRMKKFFALVLSLVMLVTVLAGCAGSGDSSAAGSGSAGASGSASDFKATILFNGSSTLAPIMASLASSFTDKYVTWDKVDPSFPAENISIYVASGGSGVGVNSVLDGTADFGMVARTVKDSEKAQMDSANYQEFVMAADALTVSVNRENPICGKIDDLSSDTIRDIFSGKIQYWDELDATLPHKEISVYIRDLSGGAYEVFQKAIMGDTQISANATQCPSMGALGTAVAENPYGIGYASFGVYNQNKDKLFAMKVDGVEPTVDTITDGSYSIQRPLMFISNHKITAPEQAFINYVFSQAGTDAIESNGYISMIG